MKTKKEDSKIIEVTDINTSKDMKVFVTENTSEKTGHYFTTTKKNTKFFSSGCVTLDCALGGGWARSRIGNIIGDESTGKTQTAIEGIINFLLDEPKGIVIYYEVEAAFDRDYAKSLGFPTEKVIFGKDLYNKMIAENKKIPAYNTVECLFVFLQEFLKISAEENTPVLLVIDSLDAISDISELDRDITDGTMGTNKARQLSQMFRRWGTGLDEADFTLIIISQTREKINAMFAGQTDCSGGKALKFYASQRLKLAEVGKVNKTIDGIIRPIGTKIKAKVIKNKVAAPYRECEYLLISGYGIDDVEASISFLFKMKKLDKFDFNKYGIEVGATIAPIIEKIKKHSERKQLIKELGDVVKQIWNEIEAKFLPDNPKY